MNFRASYLVLSLVPALLIAADRAPYDISYQCEVRVEGALVKVPDNYETLPDGEKEKIWQAAWKARKEIKVTSEKFELLGKGEVGRKMVISKFVKPEQEAQFAEVFPGMTELEVRASFFVAYTEQKTYWKSRPYRKSDPTPALNVHTSFRLNGSKKLTRLGIADTEGGRSSGTDQDEAPDWSMPSVDFQYDDTRLEVTTHCIRDKNYEY